MDNALRQIFLDLKEKTLDQECTPFRSKVVEQIDYALDMEKQGHNFIEVLWGLQ